MEEPESFAARPQIFVSYSSRDAGPAAAALRAALDMAGYEATGDWAVQSGQNWAEVLERLRREAAGVVVLITPASLASEPISLEARAFYQRASTDPGFILIPLPVDGVELSTLAGSPLGWLAEFQIPPGSTLEERMEGAIVSLARVGHPGSEPQEELTTAPRPQDDPAAASVLRTISMIAVKAPVGALALGRLNGEPIAVTGDEDGAVQVWDLATGNPRGDPLLGHSGPVWSVALGELDGLLVAVTGGADGAIRVWDLAAGAIRTSPANGHSSLVNSVAVGSPDGRLIAVSASDDRTLRVWDLATGQPVATISGHTDWVNSVALGVLDGRPVAVSGSADATVRVWDLATGDWIVTMTGHTDSVSSVTLGVLDGRPVAVSGSVDATVRVWDLATGDPIATMTGHVGRVRTVAYGVLNGRPVAISGGNDRTVRLWDLDGAPRGGPLNGHTGAVRAVAFTVIDGQPMLVSGSDDGTVRSWGTNALARPRDQVEWLSDSPADQDLLRRRPLAQAIAVRLERFHEEDPGTSFLVHVDGPWGTGKSTLVNLLRSELEHDWLAVDFNAWRQSRIGPPWWALLAALRHDLGLRLRLPARIWLRLSESWARSRRGGAPFVFAVILLVAVAAAVLVLLGPRRLTLASAGGTAQAITAIVTAVAAVWAGALVAGRFLLWDSARGARVFEQSNTNPMQDVADHFGWLVMKAKRPVVFFVDDLDRCAETYVVDFLDAVQTLVRDARTQPDSKSGQASAASFVIAADGSWLRKSYEVAFEKFVPSVSEPGRPLGYLFLDKLFQLRVPVPSIGALRRQEFLGDILRVHGLNQVSRPETAEEQSVRTSLRHSSTEAEVLGAMRDATPEIRDRLAVAALEKLTTPEVAAATEHSLQRFGPLLAPNPRSMKRFVNDYSILRAIRTLEGNPISSEPLALWAIIETQWPALADYLRTSPDAIGLLGKPANELEAVPPDLRGLFSDPAVRRLVDFEHGGPLTPELISSCCGALRYS